MVDELKQASPHPEHDTPSEASNARAPHASSAHVRGQPTEPTPRLTVEQYAATLVHDPEISELILQLELAFESPMTAAQDPGIQALLRHTNLDLHHPTQTRDAILTLGQRAEKLRAVRLTRLETPSLPSIAPRDGAALTEAMVAVLDAARLVAEDPDTTVELLHCAADDALALAERNHPSRGEEDARWWALARASIHARLVPGYWETSRKLHWLEEHYLWRAVSRSPWAMGMVTALFGLFSWFLHVPTPLVMILMGMLGAFVLHPLWIRRVLAPLMALKANFMAETRTLARLASEEPWPESCFSVQGMLEDLLPILEGERCAGRQGEASLRMAASRYFDDMAPHFRESSGRGDRYLEHLRDFGEVHVVRRFVAYGDARRRLDAHALRFFLDSRWWTAILVAGVTLPASWLAAQITPLPQSFDFPMMVVLFGGMGWYLPKMIEGSQISLETLKEELVDQQTKLEALP